MILPLGPVSVSLLCFTCGVYVYRVTVVTAVKVSVAEDYDLEDKHVVLQVFMDRGYEKHHVDQQATNGFISIKWGARIEYK